MKKIPVIVVVALGLVVAGMAEAATPKKRTRNQNRIGPYGAAFVGMTQYNGDHSADEQSLMSILENSGYPFQNATSKTENTDIGYQATFGYRFHRYIAAEIGLVQYGSLKTSLNADVDVNGSGTYVPVGLHYNFHVAGPLMSAIGTLPLNDKFELYGRVGVLFASAEREFTSKVNGESGIASTGRGDSQNLVYGAGVGWNINQMYTIRAEYQVINGVGEGDRTGGEEDLRNFSLGLIVRF